MRSALQRAIAAVFAAPILLWPELGRACAVCFSSRSEEARQAFTETTVFLTLLPLLLIGGTVWWLIRRARQLERAQAATARDPAMSPG